MTMSPHRPFLQSVLALPENEFTIKDDSNNLHGLLGRARRLGGSNVIQADEDKNANEKKNTDETTLNSRQRNLLLMTLSSPTNNTQSSDPLISQGKHPLQITRLLQTMMMTKVFMSWTII